MTDDAGGRPGHPPGQGPDLPLRAPAPRPRATTPSSTRWTSRPGHKKRICSVPGRRLRILRRVRRRGQDQAHPQPRIQDRGPQLHPLRPQGQEGDKPDRLRRPGPPAHRGQEGARQVQTGRRDRALGDPLPPGRLQSRAPASPPSSGPIRWNTATPRRPARSAARSTASPSTGGRPSFSSSPRATPSSTTPRCPSSATSRR